MMKNRKIVSPVVFPMALVFTIVLTASMLNAAPAMAQGQVRLTIAADTTVAVQNYLPAESDVGDWTDIIQVAAGSTQTVGLKSDGTVITTVGWGCHPEECETQPWEVGDWTGIIRVAAGGLYTVGLESDGTVVAVGDNYDGQCDVGDWTNVIRVATSGGHTVGLRSNGTVVAVGGNRAGQCNVGNWTDIVQVAAGRNTLGLKSDGTVVAVGDNEYGQCDVGNWTDIAQVSAGPLHTVGLKPDGTVIAVGWNSSGQCDVGNWTGISQVAAGTYHTVGLKSDGTVVAAGCTREFDDVGQCDVSNWTGITQVAAGEWHTVGLTLDDTVVAAGGYVSCELPSSRCFIATAAYGTPMAEEIQILHQFRDEYLLTNPLGQTLVDLYYRVSPAIAEFTTEHPVLKPLVRAGLMPAVAMSTVVVNATAAEKATTVGLLALVSAALTIWATRRRDGSGKRI
jgi:alpha-tubulin suppressor-like RCC1 family protein